MDGMAGRGVRGTRARTPAISGRSLCEPWVDLLGPFVCVTPPQIAAARQPPALYPRTLQAILRGTLVLCAAYYATYRHAVPAD